MTFLSTCGDKFVAVSIKNHLKIINASDGSTYFQYLNTPTTQDLSSSNNATSFVCHAFSRNASIFAALTEDKKLLTWTLGETAEIHQNIELQKRPTWLTFLYNEKSLMVADKYGDIYKCDLDSLSKPVLTLGHLSMVLTVCTTANDKYIISGDRDEKIRISYHPNAYSIHSYCLGHKNLVSCAVVHSEHLLLSTSADKTLKLWNFVNGEELHSFDLTKCIEEKEFVPSQLAVYGNNVCLIAEKCKTVHIFEISNNKISHVSAHTLGSHQPLSICAVQNGSFVVLTTNREKPIVVLGKNDQKLYTEEDSTQINSNIMDLVTDLPTQCLYLTNLVKPVRGKRENSLITPEATINYENNTSAPNKMQKLQEDEEDRENNEQTMEEE